MKAGGKSQCKEPVHTESFILPAFIPPFEASEKWHAKASSALWFGLRIVKFVLVPGLKVSKGFTMWLVTRVLTKSCAEAHLERTTIAFNAALSACGRGGILSFS